ncbi:collagenase [Anaerospora hongkongensis]|uniref:Collagenase n=1 Tax=Anaerospora hongkongensis TaxID=244830 RepID=A0A4R1PWY5_9FIRM|nr:collagenase [Anaerospora hongkongensis]TCL35546.1 collagenase [Anaerospora hongkongensis]
MRSIVQNPRFIISMLVLIVLLVMLVPVRAPRMWLYPLARDMAQAKMNYEARHMASFETAHFIIKYTVHDADTVAMVAQAAEAAYAPVEAAFGSAPTEKTLLLVYPDRKEMNKVFGWSGDQSAMGVYWGGVIQLLSPHAWLKAGESTDEFIRSGPMVHEFTHLVFDHMTNGNYTRWFTEGLAQYMEYKTNGYEWLSNSNKQPEKFYTQAELDKDFDNLPDQSLAYRSSLAAIRYIAETQGDDKLNQVMQELKGGKKPDKAITDVLGMDYDSFEREWHKWAAEHMRAESHK